MISASLIVKNEARCIERCIKSIVDAVDEIIVVDTGSTDDTLNIIEKIIVSYDKVKLFHFEWCDDFSAARNFSLSKVTGDWIFVLDADEYLHIEDVGLLRKIAKGHKYLKSPICYTVDYFVLINNEIAKNFSSNVVRFFPNNFGLGYKGKVHEFLVSLSLGLNLTFKSSKIRVYSDGYDANVIDSPAKHRRNVLLLQKMLDDDPNNGVLYYYLGCSTKVFDLELAYEILIEARKLLNLYPRSDFPSVDKLLEFELTEIAMLKSSAEKINLKTFEKHMEQDSV